MLYKDGEDETPVAIMDGEESTETPEAEVAEEAETATESN